MVRLDLPSRQVGHKVGPHKYKYSCTTGYLRICTDWCFDTHFKPWTLAYWHVKIRVKTTRRVGNDGNDVWLCGVLFVWPFQRLCPVHGERLADLHEPS